jgi:hypothetical protein
LPPTPPGPAPFDGRCLAAVCQCGAVKTSIRLLGSPAILRDGHSVPAPKGRKTCANEPYRAAAESLAAEMRLNPPGDAAVETLAVLTRARAVLPEPGSPSHASGWRSCARSHGRWAACHVARLPLGLW